MVGKFRGSRHPDNVIRVRAEARSCIAKNSAKNRIREDKIRNVVEIPRVLKPIIAHYDSVFMGPQL